MSLAPDTGPLVSLPAATEIVALPDLNPGIGYVVELILGALREPIESGASRQIVPQLLQTWILGGVSDPGYGGPGLNAGLPSGLTDLDRRATSQRKRSFQPTAYL